jgi:hypothetical protein
MRCSSIKRPTSVIVPDCGDHGNFRETLPSYSESDHIGTYYYQIKKYNFSPGVPIFDIEQYCITTYGIPGILG